MYNLCTILKENYICLTAITRPNKVHGFEVVLYDFQKQCLTKLNPLAELIVKIKQ